MTYLRPSNRERNRANKPTWISAGILTVLLLVAIIFPHFFPNLIVRFAGPWLALENRFIPSHQTDPSVAPGELAVVQEENRQLKTLLSRPPEERHILASVLLVPPQMLYDTLLLDVGRDHGIASGTNVYASSTLIGHVVDVYAETSKVILFSSPGESFEVLIGKDMIRTTATGRGGGSFEAIVPRELKIGEGDVVTIPALYAGVFGVIEHVEADPARAFATIYFKSPVNLQTLRYVTVGQ